LSFISSLAHFSTISHRQLDVPLSTDEHPSKLIRMCAVAVYVISKFLRSSPIYDQSRSPDLCFYEYSVWTHTCDNTPHRLVLPTPPFFWAGCGFTLASFSHTCVCPLVHPLCSSVPQTVTTTQYHSVSTSNGSPSSRATRLLQCFTQVSDMVSRHNRHNRQPNSTRA
jgi:hypothetical protein